MKDWLSIGEFSKKTGLSNKALRLYEEKELLVPHARRENQYRCYTPQQLLEAERIQQFKKLGFSLEQIKVLLAETEALSLREILGGRLQEARAEAKTLQHQIQSIETILISLTSGRELTEIERSQVMENLLQASIENLKKRGHTDPQMMSRLSDEVTQFPPEMSQIVSGLRQIRDAAKQKSVLLGPGRGTSPASVVLFAEGYSPINPLQFGLMPELFSQTKYLHMEVEYSRHAEIGSLCDDLKKSTGFDVVAFRSPILDIFSDLKNKIGDIHFDGFSDFDPMILEAPQRVGVRGLFGVEWNSNYHAWNHMPESVKSSKDWRALENWYLENTMQSPEDYINLQIIHEKWSEEDLRNYKNATCRQDLPELQSTHGYMLYREDWLRLLMRLTGVDVLTARSVWSEVSDMNIPAKVTLLDEIQDEKMKSFLKNTAPGVFAKSHAVTTWWYYKRTAILKSLWTEDYLAALDRWEQRNQIIWQEFGYPLGDGGYHLKAGR